MWGGGCYLFCVSCSVALNGEVIVDQVVPVHPSINGLSLSSGGNFIVVPIANWCLILLLWVSLSPEIPAFLGDVVQDEASLNNSADFVHFFDPCDTVLQHAKSGKKSKNLRILSFAGGPRKKLSLTSKC